MHSWPDLPTGSLAAQIESLADRQSGHARSDLRTMGIALIALAVIAAVLTTVLKRHFSPDK
jgi:hypothetical protein